MYANGKNMINRDRWNTACHTHLCKGGFLAVSLGRCNINHPFFPEESCAILKHQRLVNCTR